MELKASARVVITGIGAVAPSGAGVPSLVAALLSGRSLVRKTTRFDPSAFLARISAGLPPQTLELDPAVDRHVTYALAASGEAFLMAGLKGDRAGSAGVSFGTAVAGLERAERLYRDSAEPPCAAALRFHTVTDALAHGFGMCGPRFTLSTGCTAGLDAIGTAFDQVRLGHAPLMLAGAADAPLVPVVASAFEQAGALSRRNDSPETASRPFHEDRDGFVLGEGAGALIVEKREHAIARAAVPLCEILGWSSVSSAFHMTALREDGSDLARLMRRALASARVPPEEVDAVDLHATSTVLNDRAEAAAMRDVFGERVGRIPVIAQKATWGHALGASNAIEIVGAVATVWGRGMLPATPSVSGTAPDCRVDVCRARGVAASVRTLLKISSGFSGIHTAMVLRRPEEMV